MIIYHKYFRSGDKHEKIQSIVGIYDKCFFFFFFFAISRYTERNN